jgi:phosphohistidine swiveling domain-containing protein
MEANEPHREPWDSLMGESPPGCYWSRSNVGEALPGVLTPLMWGFWAPTCERTPRESAYRIGAMTRAERMVPALWRDRYFQVFYGRAAIRIDYNATVGDRVPGTTGRDAVRGVLGTVPDDLELHPTRRRYPIVAVRLVYEFLQFPRELAAVSSDIDRWWRASIALLPGLDHAGARAMFAEAMRRFDEAMVVQTTSIVSTMHPVYAAVEKVIDTAGTGDLSLLTGASGGAELAVVGDLWRASRAEIGLEDVVRHHGFHGPHEGELSSVVWREDPRPLQRMIEQYRERPDSEGPQQRETERRARFGHECDRVVHALPRHRRPWGRRVLRFAANRLPLRGVGKRAYLQANDVGRASARALGRFLAADGVLGDPEDVFYLTADELLAAIAPADARTLVALRRARRAEYEALRLPEMWQGMPQAVPVRADGAPAPSACDLLRGIGVSAGVVEGTARVVTDPSFAEVEPDEILVAPVTDPSWAAIMYISAALVVNIGGPLSHAAVVARELEIPCVVGVTGATDFLRSGDRVRVDGSTGTVTVLSRADAVAPLS